MSQQLNTNNINYLVINYTANKDFNVPALINKVIEEQKNKNEFKYLIFIQDDLLNKVIDKNNLFNVYVNFCEDWKLPFAMYQYYNTFNRILPDGINYPNPRLRIHTNTNKVCDVISQSAYGFLILNLQQIIEIDYKFKEEYPLMFYIQDFVEECYQKGITLSNCHILEIPNSWDLFTDNRDKSNSYCIDLGLFEKEREAYFKVNQPKYLDINMFIQKFKEKYNQNIESISPVQTSNLIDIDAIKSEEK